MEPGERTCVNLVGIVNTSKSENILEVGTRDRELLGVASRREDELIVVNELLPSFQHDLFSRDVDGSDGLSRNLDMRLGGESEIHARWRCAR